MSNNIRPRKIRPDAIGWVTDFCNTEQRGIHLSKEELEEFEAWLAADPQNVKAFVDAQQSWDSLDSLPGMRSAMERARQRRERH